MSQPAPRNDSALLAALLSGPVYSQADALSQLLSHSAHTLFPRAALSIYKHQVVARSQPVTAYRGFGAKGVTQLTLCACGTRKMLRVL